MLNLGKALSNQNVPDLPAHGAARLKSMGGALHEGETFRATVHCCQLKNNARVLEGY